MPWLRPSRSFKTDTEIPAAPAVVVTKSAAKAPAEPAEITKKPAAEAPTSKAKTLAATSASGRKKAKKD